MALSVFVFLCLNLTSFGISTDSNAEQDASYALLDSLVVTFKELAEKRESVMEKTNASLKEMMDQARKAKAQGQIDTIFFKRYTRILLVLKLVITPFDDSGIMSPLLFKEINAFIEDVEGESVDIEKMSGSLAINKLSEAVAHEVTNLRVYLDNKEKAKALAEQYRKELVPRDEAAELYNQKERQKMTMKDSATIHAALTVYLTDYNVLPKHSGIYGPESEIYKALVPFYIKNLPIKDSWGNSFWVYCGKACNGVYEGIKDCTERDFVIVSYGRDGKKEDWKYDPKNPGAGLFEMKTLEDLDKDLILWNGTWIRGPRASKKK